MSHGISIPNVIYTDRGPCTHGRAQELQLTLVPFAISVMSSPKPLEGADVFIFDVFGTVIDWYGNIVKVLAEAAPVGATDSMFRIQRSRRPCLTISL